MLEFVKKFVVEMFFPWFREHAWPHIQKLLIEILRSVLATLSASIYAFLERRGAKREQDYQEKAEYASRKADESTDAAETAKWKAKAEAYYEFADDLRFENSALKAELAKTFEAARRNAEEKVSAIQVEQKPRTLSIGGTELPMLPSADDEPVEALSRRA